MSNLHGLNTDANQANSTATFALISSLIFEENKTVRTSTIILAVFNILASATTAGSILYDCYWASKRSNPNFRASKFCVSSIHPAETFPLVLAIGIVVQGITFAAVQGQGLASLNSKDCSVIAQFMWPALMIVPYIQLIFGLECTVRSVRKLPFQARGKYDVSICCGVIMLMLIGTWIPSHIFREPHLCFASLLWFISIYGKAGLIILSTGTGFLLISAITILVRLSTVNTIDQHQRIAASRMVYYLLLGILSMAFVIPYFVSQTIGKGDGKLSMMAGVVLNLSGLMSGLLHLFLRSNTATASFAPKDARYWNGDKHEIRIWGRNELAFTNHLVDPVSAPHMPIAELEVRSDSRASLVGSEKDRVMSMESLRSPISKSPIRYNLPQSNAVEQKPAMAKTADSEIGPRSSAHARKRSYGLFPAGKPSPITESQFNTRPTESVYDITALTPPPMIFGGGARHHRDMSVESTRTVQIGLRISHAPAQLMALTQTTYNTLPSTKFNANLVQPASPLPVPEPVVRSPRKPSPLNTNLYSPIQSPIQAIINKTLPPTPKPTNAIQRESTIQLSPAVYSPEKKIGSRSKPVASPKSAIDRGRNNSLGDDLPATLLRSNSTGLPGRQSKLDWI